MPDLIGKSEEGIGWIWEITLEEENELYYLGKRRIEHSGTDLRVMDGRRLQRNTEGFVGELVCCSHFGVEFEWDNVGWKGDAGYDLICPLGSVGVKTVREKRLRMLVKTDDVRAGKQRPDLFILCVYNAPSRRVWIRGMIEAERVFDRVPGKVRPDGFDNYIVENYELSEPPPPSGQE